MPPTYDELMVSVRREIREVSLDELRRRLEANEAYTLLDVRETEEVLGGTLPGAVTIPRGLLELRVEATLPDKNARVVLYCAGGARAALAARTLAELGYANVETATPGFTRWRELGYPVEAPAVPSLLTEAQRARYSRQLLLPEVGEAGQARLLGSKVLIVGAGGLGAPVCLYLAAAGVGTLGLVDADVVEASNLHRQVVHATSRIGMPKVGSAEKLLEDLNPEVKVVGYRERIDSESVARLFDGYDVVVDGTDNFPTRYLINDASVFFGKPVVHGSVFRFEGQVTTFVPASAAARLGVEAGPCYRCLYPTPPSPGDAPGCQEAGVLGVLPGVIGLLQATETLKLLLGRGEPLVGRVLTYDSLAMRFRELRLRRDPACPLCGTSPTITGFVDYEGFCAGRGVQ